MEWDLKSLLILLAVLFSGYGIGLLEMHLRRTKKIKQLQLALQTLQAVPAPAAQADMLRLAGSSPADQTLELDGVVLDSPAALTPEQRRRLISLLTSLRPWLEGEVAPPTPRTTSTASPASPAPAPGHLSSAEPAAVPLSMVAQIDAILQKNLPGTALTAKRIRLSETPAGGVLVTVESQRYENLEAVPDAQVVAAIRAAIAEWERGVR